MSSLRLRPRLWATTLGLLTAAVIVACPTTAPAACPTTPACLEATFPADMTWPALDPGPAGNYSAEQFLTVTSNGSWGLRVASDRPDGRMAEWTGTAYVSSDPKVLARALDVTLSSIAAIAQPVSWQPLSSTPITMVSGQPSTCSDTCSSVQVGVRYRQVVSFADAPAEANDYRLELFYEAGQGF